MGTASGNAVALMFIIIPVGVMALVAWVVMKVVRGTRRAVRSGAGMVATKHGHNVPVGRSWVFGQPGTETWVEMHPLGKCPPHAPRHGSDGLCQYCSWARANHVSGPWGEGHVVTNPDLWSQYTERMLDATMTPWLDRTTAGWGVPRVLPGQEGWDDEARWLEHLASNGGTAHWPQKDAWGNPWPNHA